MGKLLSKKTLYDALIIIGLLCAILALILFPKESVSASKSGLALCTDVIIPSLFPFFVISSLMIELGLVHRLGRLLEHIMRPLFGVGGAGSGVLVMSFVGGYPVGAKTAIALYESGGCTKTEAERMMSWCNNSGPAFILGVVGAGVFSSSAVGVILYLAHTLSSVLVGILFRRWGSDRAADSVQKKRPGIKPQPDFVSAFVSSVKGAFSSVLGICGFVIFFTVVIRLLFIAGIIPAFAKAIGTVFSPIGMDAKWAEKLLTGFIELSSGVSTLAPAAGEISSSMAMAAFMLGWAGLSVHCQVLSFIGSSGLRFGSYFLGKLLHGTISAALVFLAAKLFVPSIPVSSILAGQVADMASGGFLRNVLVYTLFAFSAFVVILLLSRPLPKKRAGKKRGGGV